MCQPEFGPKKVFVATMAKLQQFVISEPDKVRYRRKAAFSKSVSTGCDKPVCTRGTL